MCIRDSYYVGSEDLASYLVVTPRGNILVNSNLASSPPLIKKNIEALGFKFADTKILLISHAHYDHCAGSAQVKQLTGAKYLVMDADVSVVESGGKTDFQYGTEKSMQFPRAHVDRVLHDGDKVRLGGAVLVAHLTAGHTRGTTTSVSYTHLSSGGKTGTAQKVDPVTHLYSKTMHIASFAGIAPINNPAIAVAVIIDNPKGASYYGTAVSAPVFADVAQQVLEYLQVPHDIEVKPSKTCLLYTSFRPAQDSQAFHSFWCWSSPNNGLLSCLKWSERESRGVISKYPRQNYP